LQAANTRLQDQLYVTEQRTQQQPNTVDAQVLKKRLEDVTEALVAYQVTRRYIRPVSIITIQCSVCAAAA